MRPAKFDREQSPMMRRFEFAAEREPNWLFLKTVVAGLAMFMILCFVLSLGD